MNLIQLLKDLPIDVGQGNQRFVTKGKILAQGQVPVNGQGRTLLDAGCREGVQSRYFRALGYAVTSVDIEKECEDCQVCDLNEPLPFAERSFDVVWVSEVIEHLVDPRRFLAEARRVTRSQGRIVCTTPNSFSFYFCLLAALGLTPQRIQRADHLHFFDTCAIRRLFPHAEVRGFLPFTGLRPEIRHGVGLLSPTFVIVETVP